MSVVLFTGVPRNVDSGEEIVAGLGAEIFPARVANQHCVARFYQAQYY